MQMSNDKVIRQLNSFLRGELSAVETYMQARDAVKDTSAKEQLAQCERSHQDRVAALRAKITAMGGTPSDSSGPWGVFAKTVAGGAKAMGETSAIEALEEGEDHGLADYRRDLSDLDPDTRAFVEREILPAQLQTHKALSTLKHMRH